jgi:tetratricopeptide (TPR) repeat protein
MKKLFFLFAASACLVACGGSSSESKTTETSTSTDVVDLTTIDVEDLTSTDEVLNAYEVAVSSGDYDKAEDLYDRLLELAETVKLDEAQAKRLIEAGTSMMESLGKDYEDLYSDLEDIVSNVDLEKLSASIEEAIEDVDMEELEETTKEALDAVAELAKEIDEEDIEEATKTAAKAVEQAADALGELEDFDFEF